MEAEKSKPSNIKPIESIYCNISETKKDFGKFLVPSHKKFGSKFLATFV